MEYRAYDEKINKLSGGNFAKVSVFHNNPLFVVETVTYSILANQTCFLSYVVVRLRGKFISKKNLCYYSPASDLSRSFF